MSPRKTTSGPAKTGKRRTKTTSRGRKEAAKTVDLTSYEVRLVSPPLLAELVFSSKSGRDPEKPPEFQINFGLVRLSASRISLLVAFDHDSEDVKLRVVFRADFEATSEDEDERIRVFQHTAARVGPSVLFPFIRETVASTLAKAGFGDSLVPPLMDPRRVPEPDTFVIPPVKPKPE